MHICTNNRRRFIGIVVTESSVALTPECVGEGAPYAINYLETY